MTPEQNVELRGWTVAALYLHAALLKELARRDDNLVDRVVDNALTDLMRLVAETSPALKDGAAIMLEAARAQIHRIGAEATQTTR